MTWDPSEALNARPAITYLRAELPPGERGRYFRRYHAIVVDKDLLQAERRCVLAHELIHAENRDDCIPSAWLTEKHERDVDREAARRLIPVERLIDALLWTHNPFELAEELHVDEDTLRTRVACLTPPERERIVRRLTEAASWNSDP